MKNSNFQSVYLLSHYMTGLHSVHFYRHNFESGGSSFENHQKLKKNSNLQVRLGARWVQFRTAATHRTSGIWYGLSPRAAMNMPDDR